MKITVTEAMRLKNDLAKIIAKLNNSYTYSCGKTLVNGIDTGEGQDKDDVILYLARMEKALEMSQNINSLLARFNVESGVADAVRCKSNILLMIAIMENVLRSSVPCLTKEHRSVGDTMTVVTTEFHPTMRKCDIKERLNALKARERTILAQIDAANLQTIEVPFSYEDVDQVKG